LNNIKFVEAIIEVVRQGAISNTLENLEKPPGRRPPKEDIQMSEWFHKLNEDDIKKITKVIEIAVDDSLFGICAVLDGVRAIENDNKGILKLIYENGQTKILLNNIEEEFLHDIYNLKSKL
jgi:hypothetical protein